MTDTNKEDNDDFEMKGNQRLFKKGHQVSKNAKRRTLAQQISDNSFPTKGKRARLARHFGITSSSWRDIKNAAKDNPGLVIAWDLGFRPALSPDSVPLSERKNESIYNKFVLHMLSNPSTSVTKLAAKFDLSIALAALWVDEVKGSDRYRIVTQQEEKEIDSLQTALLKEGLEKLASEKSELDLKSYLQSFSALASIYKNLQTGNASRERSGIYKQRKESSEKENEPKENKEFSIDFGNIADDEEIEETEL